MGFFGFGKTIGIDEGVKTFNETAGAVLLDVRTTEEYKMGHIPGSKNLPLQEIDKIAFVVSDYTTPLFVYCLSGARSGRAASILKKMGYLDVKNIGGIGAYTGKVER